MALWSCMILNQHLLRWIFREYYEIVTDSDIGKTLINVGDKPKDMQDKISDLPVFGDTSFAHHVPCNDDIIVISNDCESDSSVSILKKKEMKR